MSVDDPRALVEVTVEDGVAFAVMTAPPMNIISPRLFGELDAVCRRVEADPAIRVVVFQSADPEFFLAHYDVEQILGPIPAAPPARAEDLVGFHAMCERVRTMDKVSIAEIAGRVGGGGAEFCAACDMRFGALGRTVINQMEVPLGIIPGGGGTQYLPRLVGAGRALEIVLAGEDLDAETAERWGYLNRALPPERLASHVRDLAQRIAGFPPHAVANAKRSILNAGEMSMRDGLLEEALHFKRAVRDPEAARAMRRFLEAGGQTREGGLRIGELLGEL